MKTLPTGRAVVTGASSGIGAAFADRLASRGHPLLLVARRADRLETTAATLRQAHGAEVETLVADLEQADGVAAVEARLADDATAILINNAGAGGLGPTAAVSADQIERTLKLNILALARLSHSALTTFRRRGGGLLVNIGSVMAFAPAGGGAAYSGSKAFVLNFTRSLALEHADGPVQVQLLMPGPVRTEFFSSQGMSDSVFPDAAYLTPTQVVDAALAGAQAGETVTLPSMGDPVIWERLEGARQAFMGSVTSGQVAARYLTPA